MICYRCGRELPDKSPYCKGCGTQLRRHKKIRSDKLGNVLKNEIPIGQRIYSTWQVLLALVVCCSLLVGGLYVVPFVAEKVKNAADSGTFVEPEEEDDISAQVIDHVTGTIIQCTVPFDDISLVEEIAYSDGSWHRESLADGRVSIICVRRPIAESWVNTHIFQLYPDVQSVDQFDESIDVSGYTSARIQFSSEMAPDCIIEALCVNDGSFDYLFIIEMPYDMFEENYIFVDDWYNNLILVDSLTGIESVNPATLNTVSSVDALVVE